MLSPFLFNILFAVVAHAVVVRFSEDPDIVRDLVHLEEDLEEDVVGVNSDPLTCVRRAVWGMLYANDAGIVSKSCLLYTSPSPRDLSTSRMPSSA